MKDTIINLTPPIEGVQYGYNSDELKEGSKVWHNKLNIILTVKKIEGILYSFEEDNQVALKDYINMVVFCNNPKDIRFPYLVMPSKEKEVKRLAKNSIGVPHYLPVESMSFSMMKSYKQFIAGFNANPAKYTQEQMEKCWCQAITNMTVDKNNNPNNLIVRDFKDFIQSIQPTAKAVRVEMENKQETINYHKDLWVDNWQIKVEQSTEYPQGIVVVKEVIY